MTSEPLKAEDVRNAEFVTVRLTSGYDMYEVDKILEQLATTLTCYEYGVTGDTMTADELESMGIPQTKLREGYRMRDVDILLDQAVAMLRFHEAQPTRAPGAAGPAHQGVPGPDVPQPDTRSRSAPAAPGAHTQAPPAPSTAERAVPVARGGESTVGAGASSAGAERQHQVAGAAAAAPPGPAAATSDAGGQAQEYTPDGLAPADFIRKLMEEHKMQPPGGESLPVLVKTPDGRTYGVSAVASATTGLVVTLND